MENFKVISKMLILYSFVHVILVSCQGHQHVDTWFRNIKIRLTMPKTTIIQVYVQDVLGGPGQTVHEIARSNITSTSPTSFGQLFMSDDLLTAEPDPGSQAIGRAQGLVGFADLNEFSLYLSVNFFFKGGPYNGSTISVLGRNPVLDATRELSIVGGTGVFQLARGVAVASTHMNYNATGYGILKYTFYVVLESDQNDYSVV